MEKLKFVSAVIVCGIGVILIIIINRFYPRLIERMLRL